MASHLPCCLILAVLACLTAASTGSFGKLKGQHLRGCTLVEEPYVIRNVNRRTGFSGFALDYLQRLQDNLQFTYQVELWNGTRTSFIKHMTECDPKGEGDDACRCDIGVAPFAVTHERVDSVKFVRAFGHEHYRMVSRKSDLYLDGTENCWFVFRTFSGPVWALIFVGICMYAVGSGLFGTFGPPEDQNRSPNSLSMLRWQIQHFPTAVLYAYSHLIGNPAKERENGTPSFHRTAWLVLGLSSGLFLLTVYQASLTVLLFESKKTSPFKQFADLSDCILSRDIVARTAMIEDSASQEFWNSRVNTTKQRKDCGWKKAGMTVKSVEEGFTFLEENKADFFFDLEASVQFRVNRNCDKFEPVGEPFFSMNIAFILPQKAESGEGSLQYYLSHETLFIRETGEYQEGTDQVSKDACDPGVAFQITSKKLWAFFMLFTCVWSALMVYRIIFLWRRKRKSSNKPSQGWDYDSRNGTVVIDMHAVMSKSLPALLTGPRSLRSTDVP